MDSLRSVGDREDDLGEETPGIEAPPSIGSDERRMQVRAYNHWVSLLGGRAYPSLDDLDPAGIPDFGPHGVLLDFGRDPERPTIAYLGAELGDECGHDHAIRGVADVPAGSLLSRLTDHYAEILANRAPIGFEAEFVNRRGFNTLYRGILMPFSSDDVTIDFIYGVINWKEVADEAISAGIEAEVREALGSLAAPALTSWADGPSRVPFDDVVPDRPVRDATVMPSPVRLAVEAGLADRLAAARAGAECACHGADRPALNHALALAYEFAIASEALPDDLAELVAEAGVGGHEDAPMLAVAELVFGPDCTPQLLGDYAAALAYGRRLELAPSGFAMLLDESPSGYGALAEAYRAEHSAPAAPPPTAAELVREKLRTAAPSAQITLQGVDDELVLLVARREPDGGYAVVATLAEDRTLLDRALRSLAG